MSRVEIYIIKKKKKQIVSEGGGDVQNAWLGCMHIWRELEQKYLPSLPPRPWETEEKKNEYHSRTLMMFIKPDSKDKKGTIREIWDLIINPDLTWDERIVLQTTFDRGYIAYEDIPEVAAAYENVEFSNDNMKKQAEIFRKIYEAGKDGTIFGIFKNENSVCTVYDFCDSDDEGQMFLGEKNWDYMKDLRELRDNDFKLEDK